MKRVNLVFICVVVVLLSGCRTSSKVYFASASNYPESYTYIDCAVNRAVAHAFDNKNWYRNDDLHIVIKAGKADCVKQLSAVLKAGRADGMPDYKLSYFELQLHNTVWKKAWKEVPRVRRKRMSELGLAR